MLEDLSASYNDTVYCMNLHFGCQQFHHVSPISPFPLRSARWYASDGRWCCTSILCSESWMISHKLVQWAMNVRDSLVGKQLQFHERIYSRYMELVIMVIVTDWNLELRFGIYIRPLRNDTAAKISPQKTILYPIDFHTRVRMWQHTVRSLSFSSTVI